MDDMFFYDYHCCMKKHGITHDIPSIPSDNDDEVVLGDDFTANDQKAQDEEE